MEIADSGAVAPSSSLRTLLILGRVSNLPTVWSNCLAGWWLGGGSSWGTFLLLCFATSCLYVGGMFLNDAFDAEFDRLHRSNRPIPSGAITEAAVWRWGTGWLILGCILLIPHSGLSAILTLLLVGSILLYDWLHKLISFSPILMALCRFWLILLASSFGQLGMGGLAIWSGLMLGCYIVGLSYLARRESQSGAISLWPLILLAAPLGLAWIVNHGDTRGESLALSAVLVLWIIKTIAPLWTSTTPNIGHVVSGLLAGICFVDLLSVADVPQGLVLVFIALFAMALLLQRRIPAT